MNSNRSTPEPCFSIVITKNSSPSNSSSTCHITIHSLPNSNRNRKHADHLITRVSARWRASIAVPSVSHRRYQCFRNNILLKVLQCSYTHSTLQSDIFQRSMREGTRLDFFSSSCMLEIFYNTSCTSWLCVSQATQLFSIV